MTGDKQVGQAAQQACNFIMAAQNKETGGWRYAPGDEGDTSVVGWQLMGLKSGYMAGLQSTTAAFDGAPQVADSWSAAAVRQLGRLQLRTQGRRDAAHDRGRPAVLAVPGRQAGRSEDDQRRSAT